MVKVMQVDDSGTEVAAIELDDFTVEILYSGIAEMLADSASNGVAPPAPKALSKEARQRQARIIRRISA